MSDKDKKDLENQDLDTKDPEDKGNEKEPEEESPEIQALAKQLGWNPNHEGGNRPYKTATQFILRSGEIQDTMRDQLRDQSNRINELSDQLTNGIDALKKHQEAVFDAEVTKLEAEIEVLRGERREAIKDGDVDAVEEYDKKIDNIRKQTIKPVIEETPPKKTEGAKPDPDFLDWHKNNSWYKKDRAMTAVADAIARENQGTPMKTILKIVDETVREEFPHKFEKPKGDDIVPDVETTPKRTPKKKTKYTVRDLDYDQRKTGERFVGMGIMTMEEYIADLVDTGELGGDA